MRNSVYELRVKNKVYDYIFFNYGVYVFWFLTKHLSKILLKKDFDKVSKDFLFQRINEIIELKNKSCLA